MPTSLGHNIHIVHSARSKCKAKATTPQMTNLQIASYQKGVPFCLYPLIRRETVIKYDKTTKLAKRISFMEYVKAPQNDE